MGGWPLIWMLDEGDAHSHIDVHSLDSSLGIVFIGVTQVYLPGINAWRDRGET